MVSRLCAPIDGTDAGRLADCLGLDGSRYRQVAAGQGESREDALLAAAASLDDDDRWGGTRWQPLLSHCVCWKSVLHLCPVQPSLRRERRVSGVDMQSWPTVLLAISPSQHAFCSRTSTIVVHHRGPLRPTVWPPLRPLPLPRCRYKDCPPLMLTAPNGTQFPFAGVRELLKPHGIAVDTALLPSDGIGAAPGGGGGGAAVPPLTAAQLSNQVRLHMRRSIAEYYADWLRSDDDVAPCNTRNVCLAAREDARPGSVPPDPRCTGHMRQVVSEAQLYTQVGAGAAGCTCRRGLGAAELCREDGRSEASARPAVGSPP